MSSVKGTIEKMFMESFRKVLQECFFDKCVFGQKKFPLVSRNLRFTQIFILNFSSSVSLLMAEPGVDTLAYAFPKVNLITAAVDAQINDM